VKVWDMSEQKKETRVIEDNINPLYYEVLELDYEVRDIKDLESYPPFIFDLFDVDDDLFDSTDDFLARAIIELECEEHKTVKCQQCVKWRNFMEVPPEPRWHPLKFSESDPGSG
jgi:hypothetical protein